MKTIEYYEKAKTKKLQYLLKEQEKELDYFESKLNKNLENKSDTDLKKQIMDHEIDISLIRMELNKRLWYNK